MPVRWGTMYCFISLLQTVNKEARMWKSLRITSKPPNQDRFPSGVFVSYVVHRLALLLKTGLSSLWALLRNLLARASTMSWDAKLAEMVAGCCCSPPQQWLHVLRGFLAPLRQSHIQLTVWVYADVGVWRGRDGAHIPFHLLYTRGCSKMCKLPPGYL